MALHLGELSSRLFGPANEESGRPIATAVATPSFVRSLYQRAAGCAVSHELELSMKATGIPFLTSLASRSASQLVVPQKTDVDQIKELTGEKFRDPDRSSRLFDQPR